MIGNIMIEINSSKVFNTIFMENMNFFALRWTIFIEDMYMSKNHGVF